MQSLPNTDGEQKTSHQLQLISQDHVYGVGRHLTSLGDMIYKQGLILVPIPLQGYLHSNTTLIITFRPCASCLPALALQPQSCYEGFLMFYSVSESICPLPFAGPPEISQILILSSVTTAATCHK